MTDPRKPCRRCGTPTHPTAMSCAGCGIPYPAADVEPDDYPHGTLHHVADQVGRRVFDRVETLSGLLRDRSDDYRRGYLSFAAVAGTLDANDQARDELEPAGVLGWNTARAEFDAGGAPTTIAGLIVLPRAWRETARAKAAVLILVDHLGELHGTPGVTPAGEAAEQWAARGADVVALLAMLDGALAACTNDAGDELRSTADQVLPAIARLTASTAPDGLLGLVADG